jgi:NAD(P)-dependent dehydrogenase (short-subunit alcohol dehydrogenase family)
MSDRKTFVLIGGSYGIGASLAELLLADGNEVFVLSRSKPENTSLHYIHFDVSNDKIEKTGYKPDVDIQTGIAELIKGFSILTNNKYSNV